MFCSSLKRFARHANQRFQENENKKRAKQEIFTPYLPRLTESHADANASIVRAIRGSSVGSSSSLFLLNDPQGGFAGN
jgi:hypothetical protein